MAELQAKKKNQSCFCLLLNMFLSIKVSVLGEKEEYF